MNTASHHRDTAIIHIGIPARPVFIALSIHLLRSMAIWAALWTLHTSGRLDPDASRTQLLIQQLPAALPIVALVGYSTFIAHRWLTTAPRKTSLGAKLLLCVEFLCLAQCVNWTT